MKLGIFRAAALLFALSISACAGVLSPHPPAAAAQEQASSASIAEGRRLAEINCARCHAIGTEGESRHPMAPRFRRLSQNYAVNMIEEAFAEGVLVGHRDMPQFEFEPAQINALVDYLNSIQEHRGG
jgi:mono/diheme cytochrome c family protein